MMFSYLIKNGRLVDGTGRAAYQADLAIQDGKIAAIGALANEQAAQVIDAAGRYVTPGFIDIHRHADAAVFRAGFGELELRQGLTTIVNGNCGLSIAPCGGAYGRQLEEYLLPVIGALPEGVDCGSMDGYLRAVQQQPLPVNVAMLAGSGSCRAYAAGFSTPVLDDAQRQTVQALLEQALQAGAVGVSLGLGYAPDFFYTTQALIEMLAPLRGSGLPVSVHMRQEGDGVVDALREMIEVARVLRTPVEISHLKSIGRANWRRSTPEMLRLMDEARQLGVEIACDVYPYTAGSTQLVHVLPPESQQGGLQVLSARLADSGFRAELEERMKTGTDFENISRLVGFENILASSIRHDQLRRFEGMSIAEIAAAQGKDPYTCLFDLLEAAHCDVTMIDFIADEQDICQVLRDAHSCVISDSTYPTTGRLHPRVYGTYSTLLEHFVCQTGTLTLEEAVHKCTGRPAALLHLDKKGVLAPGMDADINIFDLTRVHTRATYQQPAQSAQGMDVVLVNGKAAIWDGEMTAQRAGTLLRRG